MWSHKTTWLKGGLTLLVRSPHFMSPTAKFGGHRYFGSGDTMGYVCHMILQGHV